MHSLKAVRFVLSRPCPALSIGARSGTLSSRTISTASPLVQENDAPSTTPYQLFTKSDIPYLFGRFAPQIDPVPFYAAASVFPMRVTNYVIENLIDW
jgi:hypothetical protein